MKGKRSLNVTEAAEKLDIHRRTVYRFLQKGVIESSGSGSLRRILWDGLLPRLKDDRLIRASDLALALNVNRSTIYRWVAEGRLEGIKINGLVRIWLSSVKEMLDASGMQ